MAINRYNLTVSERTPLARSKRLRETGAVSVTVSSGSQSYSGQQDSYLQQSMFSDMFERVNIGTDDSPEYLIRAKYGLYSDYGISALGVSGTVGVGGGTGTQYNMIKVWSQYGEDKREYVVSAELVNELREDAAKKSSVNVFAEDNTFNGGIHVGVVGVLAEGATLNVLGNVYAHGNLEVQGVTYLHSSVYLDNGSPLAWKDTEGNGIGVLSLSSRNVVELGRWTATNKGYDTKIYGKDIELNANSGGAVKVSGDLTLKSSNHINFVLGDNSIADMLFVDNAGNTRIATGALRPSTATYLYGRQVNINAGDSWNGQACVATFVKGSAILQNNSLLYLTNANGDWVDALSSTAAGRLIVGGQTFGTQIRGTSVEMNTPSFALKNGSDVLLSTDSNNTVELGLGNSVSQLGTSVTRIRGGSVKVAAYDGANVTDVATFTGDGLNVIGTLNVNGNAVVTANQLPTDVLGTMSMVEHEDIDIPGDVGTVTRINADHGLEIYCTDSNNVEHVYASFTRSGAATINTLVATNIFTTDVTVNGALTLWGDNIIVDTVLKVNGSRVAMASELAGLATTAQLANLVTTNSYQQITSDKLFMNGLSVYGGDTYSSIQAVNFDSNRLIFGLGTVDHGSMDKMVGTTLRGWGVNIDVGYYDSDTTYNEAKTVATFSETGLAVMGNIKVNGNKVLTTADNVLTNADVLLHGSLEVEQDAFFNGKVDFYTDIRVLDGIEVENYVAIGGKAVATVDQIPILPTAVSAFTNDAGYMALTNGNLLLTLGKNVQFNHEQAGALTALNMDNNLNVTIGSETAAFLSPSSQTRIVGGSVKIGAYGDGIEDVATFSSSGLSVTGALKVNDKAVATTEDITTIASHLSTVTQRQLYNSFVNVNMAAAHTGALTLETALPYIPTAYRVPGVVITFLSDAETNTWQIWQWHRSMTDTTGNWVQLH